MLKPEFKSAFDTIMDAERAALPSKTLKYWKLQRCWNGLDVDKTMTVSKALGTIRNIQSKLNPNRPLNRGLETLKDQIVEHGCKVRIKPQVSNDIKIVVL